MADRMVINGQVQRGTPLARLVAALSPGVDAVNVHAGDVADVCRLCDGSDETVAELKELSKGHPNAIVNADADDVRHLVELLTSPAKDEPAAESAELPADAPSEPKPKKGGGGKKKPAKAEAPKTEGSDEGGDEGLPEGIQLN